MNLDASYAWCLDVTRRRARNFYYGFLLLPAEKRRAICAIYAFMRRCDDLSDERGGSAAALENWRGQLDAALAGRPLEDPVWPAFADAVVRYSIPHRYFHEMIDGVSSDLSRRRIETFAELYDYCYHVASVAGLTATYIFGFASPEALELAEKCGIAFQLTNILRDVGEDASLGRMYLPAEDLRSFALDDSALLESDPRFIKLMQFQTARARSYYTQAAPLLQLVDRSSRPALWALMRIYSRLLERIESSNFRVITRRVRVSSLEKLLILTAGFARKFSEARLTTGSNQSQ